LKHQGKHLKNLNLKVRKFYLYTLINKDIQNLYNSKVNMEKVLVVKNERKQQKPTMIRKESDISLMMINIHLNRCLKMKNSTIHTIKIVSL